MLKDWNKMELPSDEEIENRLKAARDKLVKQQIMMKEKSFRLLFCLKVGVQLEKEVF